MMDGHHALPISRQAQLAGIRRGSVYYVPRSVSVADLALMRRLDALHLEHLFMGARKLRDQLSREGFDVGRKHVGSLMKRMGIEGLYRKLGTSKKHLGHDVYPYLLRGLLGQPQGLSLDGRDHVGDLPRVNASYSTATAAWPTRDCKYRSRQSVQRTGRGARPY